MAPVSVWGMMATILFVAALALYVGAAGSMTASFAGARAVGSRTGILLAIGGTVLHGAGLAAFTAAHAELPLVGLAPSLCTLAFLTALFLVVTSITGESGPVGLVLVPLVALLLAIALLLGVEPAGQPLAFSGVWFSFHVLLAFVGFAGLAIAFGAGLLYLLQFRALKGKRLGRMYRAFPSLPVLDRLGRRGVAVGFAALTLALVLGWAWTIRFRGTLAAADPEVIWGVVTWFAFAAAVGVRIRSGADAGRRAALASVIGFAVVVAAYILLRVFVARGEVFL
ncbi:MAG: cytochrome c biogenesis protein CcsA [Gemmatimonadota bacterium]